MLRVSSKFHNISFHNISLSSPTCIDLILTNKKVLFMKSTTFETGISDFHKLTTTISRKTISKGNANKISYRNDKALTKTLLKQDFNQN